ncbi:hypothetical protein [Clostridium sp. KNHs214]|uniref:hypothetical protein n=1 Tax=Clostridium sp. KNHs214 TaxID=1540257 RepID=UPI00068F00B8|nr:hypothetical protein [Clostridium sp. KNHs214]
MEEQNIIVLRDKLVALNQIREELVKLELDPKYRIFYDQNISPLLLSLLSLSYTSINFSTSASFLNTINTSKNSEIKDLLHLVYDIENLSEHVFCELEKQLDILIKLYCK